MDDKKAVVGRLVYLRFSIHDGYKMRHGCTIWVFLVEEDTSKDKFYLYIFVEEDTSKDIIYYNLALVDS